MNHYKWSAAVEQHSWGCEIYEAADLSVEELRRRLDQDDMKRAALKGAGGHHGSQKGTVNVDSRHPPLLFDRDRLDTQLKNVRRRPGRLDHIRHRHAKMSKNHSIHKMNALFKDVENLIKLSHLSCITGENIFHFSPLEDMVTHNYYTKKIDD